MFRWEMLGISGVLLLGFVALFASIFDPTAPVGAALGAVACALGFAGYLRWTLKKQGIPWWCSPDPSVEGRRRFHRFKVAEKSSELRVLACSDCGIRREVRRGGGE